MIYSSVIPAFRKENITNKQACEFLTKILAMIHRNYRTKITEQFTIDEIELLDMPAYL